MAKIISLEGPKGSGKSTLANLLQDKGYLLKKFDDKHLLSYEDFETDANQVFDRGALSHTIYNFLWGNEIDLLKQQSDFSYRYFKTLRPLDINDYDFLMRSVDVYVIFYSSNEQLLVDRIRYRALRTGKGAREDEWYDLKLSNQLYKAWGQFLSYAYPDTVRFIDIANQAEVDALYEELGIEYSKW